MWRPAARAILVSTMGDVMSTDQEQPSPDDAGNTSGSIISRLREWWRLQGDFSRLDPDELERIAQDCGTTSRELKDLVARGPDAALLLHQRMHALGLTAADVDRLAHGLMRDLQRTCAFCNGKAVC